MIRSTQPSRVDGGLAGSPQEAAPSDGTSLEDCLLPLPPRQSRPAEQGSYSPKRDLVRFSRSTSDQNLWLPDSLYFPMEDESFQETRSEVSECLCPWPLDSIELLHDSACTMSQSADRMLHTENLNCSEVEWNARLRVNSPVNPQRPGTELDHPKSICSNAPGRFDPAPAKQHGELHSCSELGKRNHALPCPDGCGKEFKTAADLRRHVKSVHYRIRDFICEVADCPTRYAATRKDHLFQHYRRVHNIEATHLYPFKRDPRSPTSPTTSNAIAGRKGSQVGSDYRAEVDSPSIRQTVIEALLPSHADNSPFRLEVVDNAHPARDAVSVPLSSGPPEPFEQRLPAGGQLKRPGSEQNNQSPPEKRRRRDSGGEGSASSGNGPPERNNNDQGQSNSEDKEKESGGGEEDGRTGKGGAGGGADPGDNGKGGHPAHTPKRGLRCPFPNPECEPQASHSPHSNLYPPFRNLRVVREHCYRKHGIVLCFFCRTNFKELVPREPGKDDKHHAKAAYDRWLDHNNECVSGRSFENRDSEIFKRDSWIWARKQAGGSCSDDEDPYSSVPLPKSTPREKNTNGKQRERRSNTYDQHHQDRAQSALSATPITASHSGVSLPHMSSTSTIIEGPNPTGSSHTSVDLPIDQDISSPSQNSVINYLNLRNKALERRVEDLEKSQNIARANEELDKKRIEKLQEYLNKRDEAMLELKKEHADSTNTLHELQLKLDASESKVQQLRQKVKNLEADAQNWALIDGDLENMLNIPEE